MKIKFSYFLIGLFLLILMKSVSYSHAEHYKNIKKIEMDIYRNGEIIGFSNYEFISYENILEVINKTEFEVKVLGVKLFSIKSFILSIKFIIINLIFFINFYKFIFKVR